MTVPRHMRVVALVLTLALLAPAGVRAQSDALMAAFNQYKALSEQGLYREAEPFARKVLELGTKELGSEHPTTAALINNLALLYDDQGRYAEAEPLHMRALAILEKALGPEHPHVATSLENYAALLVKTDRAAAASQMEARASAIRAKHGEQNPAN